MCDDLVDIMKFHMRFIFIFNLVLFEKQQKRQMSEPQYHSFAANTKPQTQTEELRKLHFWIRSIQQQYCFPFRNNSRSNLRRRSCKATNHGSLVFYFVNDNMNMLNIRIKDSTFIKKLS